MFVRGTVIALAVSGACFSVLFVLSWRNSIATAAPFGEVARAWVPVLMVPVSVAVATGAFRSARPSRWLRGLLVVVLAGLALRGLVLPFDTGDGICTHQASTLSGTVRGDCFGQPKMIAAGLWSMACLAVSLALPVGRRRKTSRRDAESAVE